MSPTRVALGLCFAFLACSGGGGAPGGTKSNQDLVLQYVGRDAGPFFIDQDAGTIAAVLVVDGDVDVQHFYVTPDIVVSDGASVTPSSGTSEDLISPVKYTATAADGTTSRVYTAQLFTYNLPATDPTAKGGIPSSDHTPRPPGSRVYTSLDASLLGTWTFSHSGALEVRTVGADTVFTLLEQTPNTQTVTVKVNDTLQAPTTTSGHYGWTATFHADHSYTGGDNQGDSSTGTWKFLDLGAAALLRYAIDVTATTTVSGGPTVTGTQRWYVTGVYEHALFLTRDPMMTAKSTTTYDITLVR